MYKKTIYFILGAILFTGVAAAQSLPSQSPLWVSGSYITTTPLNTSLGFQIPSLANNNCLGTDSSGHFETGTCSGGGGGSGIATTSLTASYPIKVTSNSATINFSLLDMATTTATCSGTVSCSQFVVIGSSPITITGSASGSGTVGTSTIPTVGQLAYWTSAGYPSLLGSAATSTLTPSLPLTGSFIQIGSSGSLGCQTASGSQAGCLSSTDWTTFNNKGSGTVTSVSGTNGIAGTITTSGSLNLISYLATSSLETAGQIPYWTTTSGNPAKLGTVATTSLGVTGAITFSGTLGAQIGGAGGNFGCTNASNGVTGCMSASDWGLLHTATSTFSSPLVYTLSTNAVTCPTCLTSTGIESTSTNPFMATYFVATSTTQASNFPYASSTAITASGTMFANNFYDTSLSGNTCVSESSSLIVGSTYCVTSVSATWPLASSGGTNPVISSATSSGSSAGVLSAADWTTFNNKQPALSLLAGTYSNGDVCTYASSGTLLNCNTTPTTGTVTSVGLSSTNSTLTIGSTPVTTSGTITADLNLGNSNWWTARQNFTNASSSQFTATSTSYLQGLTNFGSSNQSTMSASGVLTLGTALAIGSGGTGLSSIGASSTILTTNGTIAEWQKIDLAAGIYGTLPVANGGTGTTTAAYAGGIWWNNAGTFTNSRNATCTTALCTFTNASTTSFTAGSSDPFMVGSTGEITGYDNLTLALGQISPMRYLSFQLGTSTTWTGTSSISSALGDTAHVVVPFTGTIKTLSCATSAGTLEIEAELNSINSYIPASTTAGTYIYSNAFTKGQVMTVVGGAPGSSPTYATCTMGATQTP